MRFKKNIELILPKRLSLFLEKLYFLFNKNTFYKLLFLIKQGQFKVIFEKIKNKEYLSIQKSNSNPSSYFNDISYIPKRLNLKNSIDILIPIYNGYEFLEPLFNSIKKNTTLKYRLIVIDDCSPDKTILPLLKKLLRNHNHILLKNNKNKGFVRSVNLASKYVNNHFVILNSDTEVPSFWLERLISPIVNNTKIATTTPFTNAGTIASFPNFLEDNLIFENFNLEQIDNIFKYVKADKNYLEVPTGVGFCMGINYLVFKHIGLFDEELFGLGYGEENDFCQRAINSGYKNILVPNLFVYHKHGGSFPSEVKKKLIEKNYTLLLKKHPNYEKDVHTFIKKDQFRDLRVLLQILILANNNEGIKLIFDHSLGGGANIYTSKMIEKNLKEKKKLLVISYVFLEKEYMIIFKYKQYNLNFFIKSFKDIIFILKMLNIKEIFINELVSYPNINLVINLILELKEKNNTKITLPLHDYFIICPSYTLINHQGIFCKLPDDITCMDCLAKHSGEMNIFTNEKDINHWRNQWNLLLNSVDLVLVFSLDSKNHFIKIYNNFDVNKIKIIPHKVDNLKALKLTKRNKIFIDVGILGSINEAKGSLIIKELVSKIEKEKLNIRITLIGEINQSINSKYFISTGKYEYSKLESLIEKYNIDTFLIPSIWPETFSYTTEEIIMMNIPLIVFNLGAPAERVRKYNKGYIVNEISIESIVKTIYRVENEKL